MSRSELILLHKYIHNIRCQVPWLLSIGIIILLTITLIFCYYHYFQKHCPKFHRIIFTIISLCGLLILIAGFNDYMPFIPGTAAYDDATLVKNHRAIHQEALENNISASGLTISGMGGTTEAELIKDNEREIRYQKDFDSSHKPKESLLMHINKNKEPLI